MRHRFFLVFRAVSGETVFEQEVTDFKPLYQDVVFRAVCAGSRANDGCWQSVAIEPAWRADKIVGLVVRVDDLSQRYGLAVFADQASELLMAHRARARGSDREHDERPTWDGTVGVRHATADQPPAPSRASVRRLPYPLLDRQRCPAKFPQRTAGGVRSSIFVAAPLAADLRADSARSLDEERADFLTGYVVRESTGRVSVVVLDRIAAETETTRSRAHFGFSAQTFAAAQRVLAARATDHVIVGWHHSHPPPCGSACLMTVPACATDYVFFSVADRTVHRCGFFTPYMIALVSGKGADRRADDPIMRAYGWRHGVIRERPFVLF